MAVTICLEGADGIWRGDGGYAKPEDGSLWEICYDGRSYTQWSFFKAFWQVSKAHGSSILI
jgi:hypothetical protein